MNKYSLEELKEIYQNGNRFIKGLHADIPDQKTEIKSLDEKIYYYRLECLGSGLLVFFIYSAYGVKGIERYLAEKDKSDNYLHNNLGIYPVTSEILERVSLIYQRTFSNCDYLGCWKKDSLPEQYLVQKFAQGKELYFGARYNNLYLDGHFGGLYWFDRLNWYEKLHGKKILIISSHSTAMKRQWLSNRIFRAHNKNIEYPQTNIELEFVRPPMSMCELTPHSSWIESLQKLKDDVDAVRSRFDFDLALVSCGAYGGPIGDYISTTLNKSSFYVGGALQLYFCIKGARWNSNKIYNEFWTSLEREEVPVNAHTVEGGCFF